MSRSPFAIAFLAGALSLAACGDDGESYDTFPACVDDHIEEGLEEFEAVAHCLVDFPDLYDDADVADQASCEAFVTDEGFADSAEEACTDYFEETDA